MFLDLVLGDNMMEGCEFESLQLFIKIRIICTSSNFGSRTPWITKNLPCSKPSPTSIVVWGKTNRSVGSSLWTQTPWLHSPRGLFLTLSIKFHTLDLREWLCPFPYFTCKELEHVERCNWISLERFTFWICFSKNQKLVYTMTR